MQFAVTRCCPLAPPPAGLAPNLEKWLLGPGGAGLETYAEDLPRSPDGLATAPSDALLLRLPDGSSADDVEEAVARAAQMLVPALGWKFASDVQVGAGKGRAGAWLYLLVASIQ